MDYHTTDVMSMFANSKYVLNVNVCNNRHLNNCTYVMDVQL